MKSRNPEQHVSSSASRSRLVFSFVFLLMFAACSDTNTAPTAPKVRDEPLSSVANTAIRPLNMAESCGFSDRGGGGIANPVDAVPSINGFDDDAVPVVNCINPRNAMEKSYCTGVLPGTKAKSYINAALTRMNNKGGACSTLAAIGWSLLAQNKIHLFDRNNIEYNGFESAAPHGAGTGGWITISNYWTDLAWDDMHLAKQMTSSGVPVQRDLQAQLAHELDHLNGEYHSDPDNAFTVHTLSCGDIS